MTWSHIELGGANYGANPGADERYLPKSWAPGKKQYSILFNTLDKLIQDKGKTGVFFLNDLQMHDIEYAIGKLRKHIQQTHPDSDIKLIPLPGDYFKIKLPFTDSIHLKNPGYSFFTALDKKTNQNRLQYFADNAQEGLTFTTYFKRPFLHRLEKLGVGYKILDPHSEPYCHVDGSEIYAHGNVIEFCIKSLSTIKKENLQDFQTKYAYNPLIRHRYKDVYGRDYMSLFFSGKFRSDLTDPDFVPENRDVPRAKL